MLYATSPAACFKTFAVRLPPLAGIGSAFAVSVGYIDPGNWATDLDATRFGSTLLWSVIVSGSAAIFLQILVVRYVASSGRGLLEGIVDRFPRAARSLWSTYALAIIATEIAEFIGLVIGLQMLFGLSLGAAVGLGIAVFALMLLAGGATARGFEVVAAVTTVVLGLTYAIEIGVLHPAAGPIVRGALEPTVHGSGALLAIVGIVGATIMPHNLFLHGGLVRRELQAAHSTRSNVVRNAVVATAVTLAVATSINAAILIVGSATHATTIEMAYRTLRPVAGSAAATLFGGSLILAALAASASGACAGDIICDDGAPVRLTRFQRRALAIGPAAVLLALSVSPTALLLASQIGLGLALPAVIVPLIVLARSERPMKTRTNLFLVGVTVAVLIASCACDGVLVHSLLTHI